MTGFDYTSFSARSSFVGVPRREIVEIGDAAVVILGAPLDWGTTNRPGARFGPKAIREADYLDPDGKRPHLDTGIDPLEVLGVVDIGDVHVLPGYMEESIDRIRSAVSPWLEPARFPSCSAAITRLLSPTPAEWPMSTATGRSL
jgi:arginase family enzyme